MAGQRGGTEHVIQFDIDQADIGVPQLIPDRIGFLREANGRPARFPSFPPRL